VQAEAPLGAVKRVAVEFITPDKLPLFFRWQQTRYMRG
jgi:hypothetical protein